MTTIERSAFTERLLEQFTPDKAEKLLAAFAEYEARFTGSHFERLADTDPNAITANDIVAVSTLSVEIPAGVAVWLLSEGQQRVSTLLAGVHKDVDLWEDPSLLAPDSDLWQLWGVLMTACWPASKAGNGMGRTKLSKLLSAKRPRLVPVVDSVISTVLPSMTYWADFTEALRDDDVRATIEDATATAPDHLSLLRRIDIAIWMLNH
jgi:hypothetical protein